MRWPVGTIILGTAVAVLVGFDADLLPAQVEVGDLTPGVMVRVRPDLPRSGFWIPGRLLSATTDSIHLETTNRVMDTLHFAIADLKRLEVSLGRHRRAGRGAAVGGITGTTIGLMAGLVVASRDDDFIGDAGAADVVLVTAIVGAFGAGVGALIGWATQTERWRAVPRATLVAGVAPGAKVWQLGWRVPW